MRRDNEDEKEEDGGNSTRGLLGDILPPPSPIGPDPDDVEESEEVSGLGPQIEAAIDEALGQNNEDGAADADTESAAGGAKADGEPDTVLTPSAKKKARAAVPKKGAKGKAKGKAAKSKAKNKANATTGKRKA